MLIQSGTTVLVHLPSWSISITIQNEKHSGSYTVCSTFTTTCMENNLLWKLTIISWNLQKQLLNISSHIKCLVFCSLPYVFYILWKPGKETSVADTLSIHLKIVMKFISLFPMKWKSWKTFHHHDSIQKCSNQKLEKIKTFPANANHICWMAFLR